MPLCLQVGQDEVNGQQGFCSSYTMKSWSPGGRVLYIDVSFLDDRVSFFSLLIHIWLCCMVQIFAPSPFTVSAPLCSTSSEGWGICLDSVKSQSPRWLGCSYANSITMLFNYTVSHNRMDSNNPRYLHCMCYDRRWFAKEKQVYLSHRDTVKQKSGLKWHANNFLHSEWITLE